MRQDAQAHGRTGAQRARGAATFAPSTLVDFVVVGSGAAGGIVAKELSTRGFTVVVLEQGPRIDVPDFEHDEFDYWFQNKYTNKQELQPQSFKAGPEAAPSRAQALAYHRVVGGGSLMYNANYWRLRPLDFNEFSRFGAIPGAALADWPITYAELEPYYTKAEWELGISGEPGPFDPPRSRPYPLPPLPIKSSGVLFERGCRAIGMHPQPAPMAILSRPFNGRPACQQCGYCWGFPCEHKAKSSTLVTTIPVAEATGRCEIRPDSYARRVETDTRGRATGVIYFDARKVEHLQRARAVVLCANGAETARLLLLSSRGGNSDGLANASGLVGHNLMFNGNGGASATFEHELNDWKGAQVTRIALDYYESDPARGFYGGGGFDGRYFGFPLFYVFGGMGPGAPAWGADFKQMARQNYNRTMDIFCHGTSLPVDTNRVELDADLKDQWGLPCMRVTYKDHDDDLKLMRWLQDKAIEIFTAAGATRSWQAPVQPQSNGMHLLGTCRMGNDPRTSVVDRFHRTHEVRNLFCVDGSSMVTSGRGQPTATIQALAYRAGEHIARFARRGDI